MRGEFQRRKRNYLKLRVNSKAETNSSKELKELNLNDNLQLQLEDILDKIEKDIDAQNLQKSIH